MDYQKIYADFIADRRKRGTPDGYTENHHILPRAIGGNNLKANMVRLSARDHYFAHCCLAKIHGGPMWMALCIMAVTQKSQHGAAPFSKGRMFAIARERAAGQRSENTKIGWLLGDITGRKNYGPISDSHRAAVTAAGARPRPGKKAEVAKAVATRQAAALRFEFVHLSTGRTFEGTALEFRRMSGVGQTHTSKLVRGDVEVAKGWVLKGNEHKPRGNRDHTVRVFRHRDGRVFEGTAYDFNALHIKDSGMLSNCINGKNGVKSARGWLYAGEKGTDER